MKRISYVAALAVIGLVYGFMGMSAAADPAPADFTPNEALEYLKEAVEKHMPYGYYLEDEDYETSDVEFLKHDDDVYLLGTSTEQIRGGVVYCFEFAAHRLFAGRAIVFADGTVEFDSYVDDSSYDDYIYLFPFLELQGTEIWLILPQNKRIV